nr:hypothetical protein [uncultured Allomuricauda sp.]
MSTHELQQWKNKFPDTVKFNNQKDLSIRKETNWTLFNKIQQALNEIPSYISPKAYIDKTALIKGNVIIEDGAQIFPYTTIQGPAYIGKNCVIGNFSFIRGNCFLSENTLLGNHSYCYKMIAGLSSRIAHFCHLSYSILGYNSIASAYVITAVVKANRKKMKIGKDEFLKFGSIIGSNTHISPFCVISPNIHIGNNCFIGSHTIINKDLKSGQKLILDYVNKIQRNEISIPERDMLL